MDVYLDCASTTPVKQEVVSAMMPYLTDKWHNPSSLYSPSQQIKTDIESARIAIGSFIGAKGSEIYFTSGGSESNCWAIQGFVNHVVNKNLHDCPCVITTKIEHKSIIECVKALNVNNTFVKFLDVDSCGFVDLNQLSEFFEKISVDGVMNIPTLVSVQLANNEFGVIQSIKQISEIVHKYGAILHVDAVQAFGHIPIDVNDMGIDMLSASGHKLGMCKGVGFLYIRDGIEIEPLIYGSQMNGMRGGTENVPYIMGLKKAVELAKPYVKPDYCQRVALTRDMFISKLEKIGCELNGDRVHRLPNNINVTLPDNIDAESMLYMLDTSGIYVSSGSACNSHSIEGSYVIKAMGKEEDARSVIRITFDPDISIEQIYYAVNEIEKAIKVLRG